jgi:hypothetical protein
VNLRKGIDLFIQCAQQILMQTRKRSVRFLARSHKQNIRFFWIGHGYDPKEDMAYSIYLFEQIRRSNLEDHVFFVGELIGLKTAYQTALERARVQALIATIDDSSAAPHRRGKRPQRAIKPAAEQFEETIAVVVPVDCGELRGSCRIRPRSQISGCRSQDTIRGWPRWPGRKAALHDGQNAGARA